MESSGNKQENDFVELFCNYVKDNEDELADYFLQSEVVSQRQELIINVGDARPLKYDNFPVMIHGRRNSMAKNLDETDLEIAQSLTDSYLVVHLDNFITIEEHSSESEKALIRIFHEIIDKDSKYHIQKYSLSFIINNSSLILMATNDEDTSTYRYEIKSTDSKFNINNKIFESCRIGRDENCEIKLNGNDVSKLHASISYEDNSWIIQDNESTNGLWKDLIQKGLQNRALYVNSEIKFLGVGFKIFKQ